MKLKIPIAILLALRATVAPAMVIENGPSPIADAVNQAAIIAQVRIKAVIRRNFTNGSETDTCGTNYVVDVMQTLKGDHQAQRTFSVIGQPHRLFEHVVKPGDELLVFLVPRHKHGAPAGALTDVIRSGPSLEELRCRKTLSTSTLLEGDRGGFTLINRAENSSAGAKNIQWFVFTSSGTKLPDHFKAQEAFYKQNCTELTCERDGRRMVPWESMQAEIRRWLREAPGGKRALN